MLKYMHLLFPLYVSYTCSSHTRISYKSVQKSQLNARYSDEERLRDPLCVRVFIRGSWA